MAWLTGWENRVRFRVDNSLLTGNLINYPFAIWHGNGATWDGAPDSFHPIPIEVINHLQNSHLNDKKIAITTDDGVTQCYFMSYSSNRLLATLPSGDTSPLNDFWSIWVLAPFLYSNYQNDFYLYYDINQEDNVYGEKSGNVFSSSTNIAGYWDFENLSYGHILDSSINKIDGIGTGVQSTSGIVLNTLALGDGYFTLGSSGISQIYSNYGYTISGWINDSQKTGAGAVYKEYSLTGDSSFTIYATGTNRPLRVQILDENGASLLDKESLQNISSYNEWTSFAWVDSGGNASLYINGVKDQQTFSYTPGTLSVDTTVIGLDALGTGVEYEGSIDELTTYNTAKSDSWARMDSYRYRSKQNNIPVLNIAFDSAATTTTTPTTTSTTTNTTTTNTTTRPPRHTVLGKVETVEIINGSTKIEQDGSDNKATLNTIDSESLELGAMAPGETSSTKIIFLRVPSSLGINNIKLGLIDTGGINFTNSTFGVETLNYLDYNYTPSSFFDGVNEDKNATSSYNITVPNSGSFESQYIYLNVTLPNDHEMGAGVVRYKWFFDYDSGVTSTGSVGSSGVISQGLGSEAGAAEAS